MLIKQNGIATLAVTLILVLIATVATLYANRQAFIFQKTSANYYANNKAFEAAEAGANEFAARIQSDLNIISTGGTGTEIITPTVATGATACRDNFFNAYSFVSDFADSTSPNQFASDRYFSKRLKENGAPDSLGLGFRVRAVMNGLSMTITSTGCADDSTATPSNTAPACVTAGQPTATVSVVLPLKGRFNPNKAGFSVKGYADSRGSITSNNSNPPTTGFCPIVSGDSFTRNGATDGTITPYSDIAALTQDQYFEMYFGSPKSEVKAAATAAGTVFNSSGCPTVTGNPLTVWIEGDFNPGSCTISAKNVIVNGNIIGNSLNLQVNGLLYANNLYSKSGTISVLGALAIAGDLDAAALGQTFSNFDGTQPNAVNGKTDATNGALFSTHSMNGSTHVVYDPTKLGNPIPPGGSASQFKAGLWRDF
ncbi:MULTISPECIES: pilus assembly PilX family protein [Deefgea]|uniref:Type 4 fimbrial biogenesis protein PilX N-terminal domain-containing protein n=1 Tax=Deefgea chitinilytica TaxID=570276 RepID=A0ABS2C9Z2_9NEIS|nr:MULTISPECIES: pilus assembly PilX N-terminal domain-containing protein [Deefgea]MBM5570293.1 hypothetical protein [Deefgea chitinilytica]MBM9887522.1 pilus assembly PilX N-terminal domain-containing protein [Deefgea sp. CFH1-16]